MVKQCNKNIDADFRRRLTQFPLPFAIPVSSRWCQVICFAENGRLQKNTATYHDPDASGCHFSGLGRTPDCSVA